jgi:hypothetical protein
VAAELVAAELVAEVAEPESVGREIPV